MAQKIGVAFTTPLKLEHLLATKLHMLLEHLGNLKPQEQFLQSNLVMTGQLFPMMVPLVKQRKPEATWLVLTGLMPLLMEIELA